MYSCQSNRLTYIAIVLFFTVWNGLSANAQPVAQNQATYYIDPDAQVTTSFKLRGRITNHNRTPITGATVVIQPGNHKTLTDGNGRFIVRLKNTTAYRLEANATGYHFMSVELAIPAELGADTVIERSWQMQEASGVLSDVEVSALTKKQVLASAPIKAQVIDLATEKQKPASLIELLNQSAGVRIRQTGGLGSPTQIILNGFQDRAVRFFKDGIPTDYLGAAFDLGALPVNMLDHVDIYKGVLPTYLGADALGGAVNLVSRHQSSSYLNASYSYGSFNTHTATINGALREPGRAFFAGLNSYVNYSDNHYGVDVDIADNETGIKQPGHVKLFHSRYKSYYVEGYIGWEKTAWADLLKLSLTRFDVHRQFPFGSTMDIPFGQAKGRQSSWVPTMQYKKSFLDNRLKLEEFLVANTLSSQTTDTANGHYDWHGDFYPNEAQKGELSKTGSLADIDFKYRLSRTQLSYQLSPSQEISANLVINQNIRKGKDPRGDVFADGTDILSWPAKYNKMVAAFGWQSTILAKKLENNLIAKFFHYSTDATRGDGQGSPVHSKSTTSAWGVADGLKFAINAYSFLTVSAETALRLPERDELFGDGHLQLANFELKPERSFNVNAGYKVRVPEKYALELNGFYRHTKNLILLMPINLIYAQRQNVDEVRGAGLDLDASYYVFPWLRASGNFTYQNVRLINTGFVATEKARLKNTPYFFAGAALNGHWYNILGKGDKLNAYWLFSFVREYYLDYIPKSVEPDGFLGLFGHARIDARNIIPDQRIHTIGLNYVPVQLPFSLGLEVKNIFNAPVFDQFRIQNPGRRIALKINFNLD